jgi:hypothetical protein
MTLTTPPLSVRGRMQTNKLVWERLDESRQLCVALRPHARVVPFPVFCQPTADAVLPHRGSAL